MQRLALDHITVVDTTPSELVEVARATGCDAVCMFLEPMEVLPRLPHFDLYGDSGQLRETSIRLRDLGVSLDVAYPFTLAGRTEVSQFRRALECASTLGAKAVNALVYDRDPARREDKFTQFCELAGSFGLGVVVEFYPLSQVKSLDAALAIVDGKAPNVGVNVDLLHLVRSGGRTADLAAAPADRILYGQLCDGPEFYEPTQWDYEASSQRLLAGGGVFDIAGFYEALPSNCAVSVELPQEHAIQAGIPVLERARRAVDGMRATIETIAAA